MANGPSGSEGFSGAVALLVFVISVAASFVALPEAYAMTFPWLRAHVLSRYGPEVQSWGPFVWKALLALLIYGAVRTALFLVLSMLGLTIALGLLDRHRRD